MYTLMLLILAVSPPVLFLLYLLKADRTEPEPLEMVLFALALGIVSTMPASIFEGLLGFIPVFNQETLSGIVLTSFIQVAPVEEGCKLAVILLFVWKNRNFNEENDGIVYVTASSIGFALFENVLYVLAGGIGTGIGRAFTSIPLHTFCGVLMGSFVGRARFAPDRRSSVILILKGFAIAWFIHGLYDSFAMASDDASATLLLVLVASLFVAGRYFVRKGKALSEARWANPDAAPQIAIDTAEQEIRRVIAKYGMDKLGVDDDGKYFLKPERQFWKIVTSRLLIGFSITCWILVPLGVLVGGDEELTSLVFYFCVMLTSVPIVLGIMLATSYHRRLTKNHYF
jgi:RsiW-degrading membrane proteinase PrsW (M82 family)